MKNEHEVLSVATGASASASEYILELDGFNAIMVVDMLTKRYHNYVRSTRNGVPPSNSTTAISWT